MAPSAWIWLMLQVSTPAATRGAPPAAVNTTKSSAEAQVPALISSAWQDGGPRWFFSSAVDVGFQYGRPRGSIGYGRPHRDWAGLDFNPVVSSRSAGAYAGLRLAWQFVNLRVGGRYMYGFTRSFLPVQDSYNRQEIEFRGNNHASYLAGESELTLTPRIGPGQLLSETAGTIVTGVPNDRYVFEEYIRVVTDPPYILRQRLGYGFLFFADDSLSIAPVVEAVWVPRRDTVVWRGGVVARFYVYSDVHIRVNLVPVISSPDSLGIAGGDFAQFGLRWLWATH